MALEKWPSQKLVSFPIDKWVIFTQFCKRLSEGKLNFLMVFTYFSSKLLFAVPPPQVLRCTLRWCQGPQGIDPRDPRDALCLKILKKSSWIPKCLKIGGCWSSNYRETIGKPWNEPYWTTINSLVAGLESLEHDWIMNVHSVGTFVIPADGL